MVIIEVSTGICFAFYLIGTGSHLLIQISFISIVPTEPVQLLRQRPSLFPIRQKPTKAFSIIFLGQNKV
jgi:hypothetical protein